VAKKNDAKKLKAYSRRRRMFAGTLPGAPRLFLKGIGRRLLAGGLL
jgi:hypothetical protein